MGHILCSGRVKNFHFSITVQISSVEHSASFTVGAGAGGGATQGKVART